MNGFMKNWLQKPEPADETEPEKASENDEEVDVQDPDNIKLICEAQNVENKPNSQKASNENTDTDNCDSDSNNNEVYDVPTTSKKRKISQVNTTRLVSQFPWLSSTTPYLFCKLCNIKITGQKFHVSRHSNSVLHQKNENAAKSTPNIKTMVNDNTLAQKTYYLTREAELRICVYLCEHNLAFLLSDTLPTFCKSIFPDSEISAGVKMKRKKATQLIVGVISPHFKEEIASDLRNAMFSIIIDETTDIGWQKSLIFIVRYWKDGVVQDKIFELIQILDASAQGIFDSLKRILDSNKIPYKNLIGFAADNASTMMGQFNGVQAKLKDLSPNMYVQGCSSHSLHLCASAAAKTLPNSVEQFTRDVYAYFSHSSKRLEEFAECEIFCHEKPTKLLYPSQTRWLSLRAVVNRILEHWNSLNLFFARAAIEENLPMAKSILGALRSDIYKIYLIFLSYILELVTKLNLELQSEEPKLPVFLERITSLYKLILKCFIKRSILDKVPLARINVQHSTNYIELENIFFGAKVEAYLAQNEEKISSQDLHNFRLKCLEFYIALANQIKTRFTFNDPYLQYAANFTPQNALSGDILSIAKFANLFPQVEIDIESANTEWMMLSEINKSNFHNLETDLTKFWKHVETIKNGLDEKMFPNLMCIVKIILSLPHSSAAAERAFSNLTLIKTKIRNRLLISTCAAILIIKDRVNKGGSLQWRPPRSLLNYDLKKIENVVVEDFKD